MLTKNKCQQKTNVNKKQMSNKKKYKQKINVNKKQKSTKKMEKISTKNKCQPKILNLTQLSPT